ncbi:hypothetical protein HII31_05469 [Pseudocercospora fuligena]|uniref:Uncharacterized protein n=1 Tax=Pseudocercospora fuligena TaxID=685502 RepID=A0A8H6VI37_9PEZI|nr:hypothetical protein HII31_05469 [Pseudocercospora fuligena]
MMERATSSPLALPFHTTPLSTQSHSPNSRTSTQHTQVTTNLGEAQKMTLPPAVAVPPVAKAITTAKIKETALTTAIGTGGGELMKDVYKGGKRILKGGPSKHEREMNERIDRLEARQDAIVEQRLRDEEEGFYSDSVASASVYSTDTDY